MGRDRLQRDVLQAGETVLHYTVLGLIAEGGMAEVYLARDSKRPSAQSLVVLKRIRPHLLTDPRFETMFVNEARLATMIDHPNVVNVHGLARAGLERFLVMEFLNGKNLLAIGKTCDTGGFWVPHGMLARIVANAADGLHHAHTLLDAEGEALNLVHRDMSPENIIVTYGGIPKVVDFGVAKARLTPETTQMGVVKGKLNYLPLEAVQGERLDARADIYALGVTLYLFLTARFPFVANSADELMDMMYSDDPPPPREVNPRVPEEMSLICQRCLEKDRKHRYPSAEKLRLDLEHFIESTGASVTARHVAAFMNQLYPREEDSMRSWIEAVVDGAKGTPEGEFVPQAALPIMQHGGTAEMDVSEDDLETLSASNTNADIWSSSTDIHRRAHTILTNLEASGLHVQRRSGAKKISTSARHAQPARTWRSPIGARFVGEGTRRGAMVTSRVPAVRPRGTRTLTVLLVAGGLVVAMVLGFAFVCAPPPSAVVGTVPLDASLPEDAGASSAADAATVDSASKKPPRVYRKKKRKKRRPKKTKPRRIRRPRKQR